MANPALNLKLIKKYHQDLVYNYAEYPTCDHWSYSYNSEDYKKSLVDWLPKNQDKPIFFYVHIPFCEQLCWFCTCSKVITNDYKKVRVSNYIYFVNYNKMFYCRISIGIIIITKKRLIIIKSS